MHRVKLVVRLLEGGTTVGGYARRVELPFVPSIGMRFEQGVSTRLWETADGDELSPAVEELLYDFDEEEIVCLFTIAKRLASSFWTSLKYDPQEFQSKELNYFKGK